MLDTFALARLLGLLITDGTVDKTNNRCSVFLGTKIDAKFVSNDIYRLCGRVLSVKKQPHCLSIGLPHELSIWMRNIKGINSGGKINQKHSLPEFILRDDTPKCVLREFLSGLFSGDGCGISLNPNSKSFNGISFIRSSKPKYKDSLIRFMNNIIKLLKRLGISAKLCKEQWKNGTVSMSLYIYVKYTVMFHDLIGFKYCMNKHIRLSSVVSYIKYRDNITCQMNSIIKRAEELWHAPSADDKRIEHYEYIQKVKERLENNYTIMNELIDKRTKYSLNGKSTKEINRLLNNCKCRIRNDKYKINTVQKYKWGGLSLPTALKIAIDEFDGYILNKYSIPTYDYTHDVITNNKYDRSKTSMNHKYFPDIITYLKRTNSYNFFQSTEKITYAISQDDECIPTYLMKVVNIKNIGKQSVYDIEISETHNYIANGIIVHNCHDPNEIRKKELNGIIRSMEIEKKELMVERDDGVKEIKQEYKELINNVKGRFEKSKLRRIRDKIIEDHKEEYKGIIEKQLKKMKPYKLERSDLMKKKPLHKMCTKRHYRWRKEPIGILPQILTDLLNTRALTKKKMKEAYKKASQAKTIQEKKKWEILGNVLNNRQLALKISCNSAYGAMGVKKGFLPFMPGAMCLSKDTLISTEHGSSVKIVDLSDTNIWSCNKGQYLSKHNGIVYKGVKDVVKIIMSDGSSLKCTPDHKILTTDGWIEAQNLEPESTRIIMGVKQPYDVKNKDEKNYTIAGFSQRKEFLAFSRVLGFILADGSISLNKHNRYEGSVCLGTMIDATSFVTDIELLTGKKPSITSSVRKDIKGSTYKVSLPKNLVEKIVKLDGVGYGKKLYRPRTLPLLLLEEKCPKSVIREFLAGFFGGDGISPSLSVSHPSFTPIKLELHIIKKYNDSLHNFMTQLSELLNIFDINTTVSIPVKCRSNRMTPKDQKENPRYKVILSLLTSETLKFGNKIGFRYCINKSNRLTIASSYCNLSESILKQRKNVISSASKLYDKGGITMTKALEQSTQRIYSNNIPLNNWGSYPTVKHIYNYRSKPESFDRMKLLSKYYMTSHEYVKFTGTEHWFNSYSVNRSSKSVPTYSLQVKGIIPCGKEDVYDILDVDNRTFLANGMYVHNCTTYAGRQDIQLTAKTVVDDYGGKLIYGDSVTKDTPILIKYENDSIDLITVDELGKKWVGYKQFKHQEDGKNSWGKEQSVIDCQIWTNNKWSNIKRVIRHNTNKKLYRILTHTGCIDVTEDHSLLTADMKQIKPEHCNIGTKLLHSFPTEFYSFDAISIESSYKTYKCISCLTAQPEYEYYTLENKKRYKKCKQCCHRDNSKNSVKKLSYISEHEYYRKSTLTEQEAFVWGFFMADGSCTNYNSKYTWVINNSNINYLKKALDCLLVCEPLLKFKILDTIKSSGVYKLVPVGKIKLITQKYRQLFYDKRKYKIVPYSILNSSIDIRMSFLDGYYIGDGYKAKGYELGKTSLRMDCKGKIGAQGLYFLLKSIGYKYISINTRESKPDIFRINCSHNKFRKDPIKIKKIIELPETKDYVYDIETDEGIFHAGIGELIVKNTDSNYIRFPDKKTPQELWDYAIHVGKEITKLYKEPMELEFEDAIYMRYLILSKKRYMYKSCGRDGKIHKEKDPYGNIMLDKNGNEKIKVGKKGVLLSRRDNCNYVRNIYENVVKLVFEKHSMDEILFYILEEINKLCSGFYKTKDFIITKSIKSTGGFQVYAGVNKKGKKCWKMGDYTVKKLSSDPKERKIQMDKKNAINAKDYYLKCLPAQVQLSVRMKQRGQLVASGSRLGYVVTTYGDKKSNQSEKLEDAEYFDKHRDVLKLDYFYYLKSLVNPMDQLLNIVLKNEKGFIEDFVMEQFKYRYKVREAVMEELKSYFLPEIEFK